MGKNKAINLLIRKLDLLYKQKEKSHKDTSVLDDDINTIEAWLGEYFTFGNPREILLPAYNYLKMSYNRIKYLWPDYEEFRKCVQDTEIKSAKIPSINLNKNDLFSIVHDFYENLDPEIYKLFAYHFKMREDHINFLKHDIEDNSQGDTIFLKGQREAFINIEQVYTIDDINTLVHEYMHAVCFSLNPKHDSYPYNFLQEIPSLFIELLFCDYYTNLTNDKNTAIILADIFNDMLGAAREISIMTDLIKSEEKLNISDKDFISKKDFKMFTQKVCQVKFSTIEDLIINPSLAPEKYLSCYEFAIELYYLYQKNKEEALNYLRKIIIMEINTEKEYYLNIKRLGLIPNQNVNKFHKSLQARMRSLK